MNWAEYSLAWDRDGLCLDRASTYFKIKLEYILILKLTKERERLNYFDRFDHLIKQELCVGLVVLADADYLVEQFATFNS